MSLGSGAFINLLLSCIASSLKGTSLKKVHALFVRVRVRVRVHVHDQLHACCIDYILFVSNVTNCTFLGTDSLTPSVWIALYHG